MIPTFDFETYSEAGFYFDESVQRWRGLAPTNPGLPCVGAAVYAEHPTTEVLCVSWDLGDGLKFWVNGGMSAGVIEEVLRGDHAWMLSKIDNSPAPLELITHVLGGGLLEAHNSMFEYLIWDRVGKERMGWIELKLEQLRCSQAKGKAFGLPSKLEQMALVLGVEELKGLGEL